MTNIFPEVTAAYYTDRVLKKFDTPANTLPYTLDDIKISHNDYLLDHVYNDAIEKLYNNFLFLIANAEIYTSTSPSSSINALHINDNYVGSYGHLLVNPGGTKSLSSVQEVFFTKTENGNENLVFVFGKDNSIIFRTNKDYTTFTGIISSNQIEFNRDFEYKNVVSVDKSGDFLFVLDNGNDTLFKLDIAGLLYNDPAIQRRGLNDNIHPGRYIVKTMGGKGKFSRKNKLNNPKCIKVYGREIYVLDNGNLSIKVFDTNFNYLRDYVDKEIFLTQDGDEPVSLTVTRRSNLSAQPKIFVLTKKGKIITLDTDFKNKEVFTPYKTYSSKLDSIYAEQSNFKKIVESKREKNIIYLCTNKRIIKFYKTNLNIPIGVFDLKLNESDRENLETVNTFDVALLDSVDGQSDFFSVFTSLQKDGFTQLSFYLDQTISERLYYPNFYENCFVLRDIKIKTQELVNSITFNKTTEKLVYNHSAFFENLCKKIYSYYDDNRVPTLSTVIDSTFTLPDTFNITNNFYIGLNEPLITDVINRPLTKLYEQQVDLFNLIKENYTNNYPPIHIPEVIPSKSTTKLLQTIKFDDSAEPNISEHSIKSWGYKDYKIIRDTISGATSFDIYQQLTDGAVSTDFINQINSGSSIDFISFDNKKTLTFAEGVSSIDFRIKSNSKFYDGTARTVSTLIINPSANAIIDQTNLQRILNVKPTDKKYIFTLSVDKTLVKEGESIVATVRKNNISETEAPDDNSYCYLVLKHNETEDKDFTTSLTEYLTGKKIDFSYYPTNENEKDFIITLSADNINEAISESFMLELSAPSVNAQLSTITENIRKRITVGSEVDVVLDADYSLSNANSSTNTVSGINVWELLDSTGFREQQNTNFLRIKLNIPSGMIVYSPTVENGAIYFEPPSNSALYGGTLFPRGASITINNQGIISGKGGDGGKGIIYTTGHSFYNSTKNDIEITGNEEGPIYIQVSDVTAASGQNGGPAIKLANTYFQSLSVNNSGSIYGGGGGGGAGQIKIIDDIDSDTTLLFSASATSGGGGGGGYMPRSDSSSGTGTGGSLFDVSTDPSLAPILGFVTAGSNGTQTAGGTGGTIDLTQLAGLTNNNYTSTHYRIMSGGDGGDVGENGDGFDSPGTDRSTGSVPAGFEANTILDLKLAINAGTADEQWAKRYPGGLAGYIVTGGISWDSEVTDKQSGTFKGR